MEDASPLLTVPDVARLLRVRESTIYTWVETGALPSVRVGRLLRFRPEAVESWLQGRTSPDGSAGLPGASR